MQQLVYVRIPASAVLGLFAKAASGWLISLLLLTLLGSCRSHRDSDKGRPMKVAVGEIKEVTLTARAPIVGSSENQEVVDVSLKPMTSADSTALQQGTAVPMVFLIKGVTIGSARVILSEKTADNTASGQVRRAYKVQVVSQ